MKGLDKPLITINANETIIKMTSVDGTTVEGTLAEYIEIVKSQAVQEYKEELVERIADWQIKLMKKKEYCTFIHVTEILYLIDPEKYPLEVESLGKEKK